MGVLQPSKAIRVAYFQPYSVLYGSERTLVIAIRHLDRTRFEPHVFLPQPGPLEGVLRALGVRIHRVPWLRDRYLSRRGRTALGVLKLIKLLALHRIDVVHLNMWLGREGRVASLAARAVGARVVVGVRTQLERVSAEELRWLSGVSCVMPVTRAAAAPLFEHGPDGPVLDPSRFVIIPPGRELDRLGAPVQVAELESLGMAPGIDVVGTTGAIDPIKGSDVFVRTAAILARRRAALRFVMVGSPYSTAVPAKVRYAEELRQLANDLGLSERLVMAGYRPNAASLIGHFSVFVHPSRSEASGGALIEAMAQGRPIVAAAVGGIPEIVKDGEAGVLVRSHEPEHFADAVLELLDHPERARKLGESAKAWAQRFEARHITRRMEECYVRLVAEEGRAVPRLIPALTRAGSAAMP
jgi:glycosyltransferase involved in cell wall biosynthesis